LRGEDNYVNITTSTKSTTVKRQKEMNIVAKNLVVDEKFVNAHSAGFVHPRTVLVDVVSPVRSEVPVANNNAYGMTYVFVAGSHCPTSMLVVM
jgi:hypothetical protein